MHSQRYTVTFLRSPAGEGTEPRAVQRGGRTCKVIRQAASYSQTATASFFNAHCAQFKIKHRHGGAHRGLFFSGLTHNSDLDLSHIHRCFYHKGKKKERKTVVSVDGLHERLVMNPLTTENQPATDYQY